MSTVILAGSTREGDAYRTENGPRYAVYNPTLAQIRSAEVIIELPSFARRVDRFAMEQARDSNLNFGHGVDYRRDPEWVWPKPKPEPEPEEPSDADMSVNELLVYQLDLTDGMTLELLKGALNKVGLTLKRLPEKKTQAEAPVVDAPVEF